MHIETLKLYNTIPLCKAGTRNGQRSMVHIGVESESEKISDTTFGLLTSATCHISCHVCGPMTWTLFKLYNIWAAFPTRYI